ITAILLHYAWEGREPKCLVPGKATLKDIHDGLKDLKLIIKYQRFDLEATKREVVYLQGLLGNK
ncbi:hypothetical protein LCGC14_2731220, partial [marine sediment metagenome]